jgi:hypothetical protein
MDALVDLYKGVEKMPFADAEAAEERPLSDPFGFAEKRQEPRAPREAAREATDRLLRFFHLVRGEYVLTPKDTLFAAELFALNVLNATDIPLSQEEIATERKDAYEFYKKYAK